MNELDVCPFCKGEVILMRDGNTACYMHHIEHNPRCFLCAGKYIIYDDPERVVDKWNWRKHLKDIYVLEDQLVGVDSIYFLQFIENLKNKQATDKNFVLSRDYLTTVIDKIFG